MKACCVIDLKALWTSGAVVLIGANAAAQPLPDAAAPVLEGQIENGDLRPLEPPLPVRQAGEVLPFAQALEAPPQVRSAPSLLALPPLPQGALVVEEGDQAAADVSLPGAEALSPLDGATTALESGPYEPLVQQQPSVIQTQQLSSQDVASIGVLGEAETGFSTQIWQRSRAQNILAAWDDAPTGARSPVIQATLETLALAVASSPPVSDANAWALVDRRVSALVDMGALESAMALMSRLPSDIAPSSLLRKKAEIALWGQDWSTACNAARIGLERSPSQYWTNLTLGCRAVTGNRAAVDLLLDVLSPSERPTRAFMQSINAVLNAADPSAPSANAQAEALGFDIEKGGALAFAMASQLGQSVVPDRGFLDQSAIVHASVALASLAPLDRRWPGVVALAYNTRLEAGAMLQYLAAAAQTTKADEALGVAPRDFLRPLSLNSPVRRVEALLDLSRRAGLSGLQQFWAPAVGEVLATVTPSQMLWPDVGDIAAHLAFAGKGQAVVTWYEHVRANAVQNDLTAAQSMISIWPYAVLFGEGGETPFTPRIAQLWWETLDASSADVRAQKAIYFFTALEALGYPVAPELWAAVAAESGPLVASAPAGIDVDALKRMGQNGEVGRGILLSLAALGSEGTRAPDPKALDAAMRTLVALGQDRLARQLASEVLFYSGVSQTNGR